MWEIDEKISITKHWLNCWKPILILTNKISNKIEYKPVFLYSFLDHINIPYEQNRIVTRSNVFVIKITKYFWDAPFDCLPHANQEMELSNSSVTFSSSTSYWKTRTTVRKWRTLLLGWLDCQERRQSDCVRWSKTVKTKIKQGNFSDQSYNQMKNIKSKISKYNN